jgi:cytochrome P450
MNGQTVSAFSTFILAMCLYPDAQKKAQAELDHVLGGRLADFADQSSLPYINAVIKECLRWRPVIPLSEYILLETWR